MKKFLLCLCLAIPLFCVSDAEASDPRISRIIYALEALTDRMDRLERSYGGGSYSSSPASYRQASYGNTVPVSFTNGGGYGSPYRTVSNRGYGGQNEIVIRFVVE